MLFYVNLCYNMYIKFKLQRSVFMNLAVTCSLNEFCTNCPARKTCEKRILFYDEKKFNETLLKSNDLALSLALSLGLSAPSMRFSNFIFTLQMQKKRKRELEEHPTYSAE